MVEARPQVEKLTISTADNEYFAIVRLDTDTGILQSGLLGSHVEAPHMVEMINVLQGIADLHDGIGFVRCLVIDPGEAVPEIREYLIGKHPEAGPSLFGTERVQWCCLARGSITRAGRLPPRWIIRPDTPENRGVMLAALMTISDARRQLADAEDELEDMKEDNPLQMHAFPAVATRPTQETQ